MNEFYFTKTTTKSIEDTHPWAILNRNDREFESMFFENRRLARFVSATLNARHRGIVGEWISGEILYHYEYEDEEC